MRSISLIFAASLAVFVANGALALDAAAPDSTSPKTEMKPTKAPASADPAARSAKSIECSQKADAQNLHGKPRKHFMRECKRAD